MSPTRPERLMIFARAPVPGRVKTRLVPELGAERAAELHAAFTRDIVARHARPGRTTTVWRAGEPEDDFWGTLQVPQRDQTAGDLGARMRAAFEAELAGGARVVILGTDSPTLPPSYVDAAFAVLDAVPAVIGPACDGGYYLLGLRDAVPDGLFEGLPWGTEDVLSLTLRSLQRAACRYVMLSFWYDVDRPSDLALLSAHLPALREAREVLPTASVELLARWAREPR